MKRTKTGKKMLSMLLSAALLLPSLAAPDLARADDAAGGRDLKEMMFGNNKVSLNFHTESGGWNPQSSGERLWLDIADNSVVVDRFGYEIVSDNKDLYEIDSYGYLRLKDGAAPAGNAIVVQAAVEYYDGADVVFADNVVDTAKLFDDSGSGQYYNIRDASAVTAGTARQPGQVARTGKYGITTNPATKNNAPYKSIGGQTDVTLTGWYYDPHPSDETLQLGSGYDNEAQLGLHINQSNDASGSPAAAGGPASYLLGLANISGGSSSKYSARLFRNGSAAGSTPIDQQYAKTAADRTEGWHRLTWVFSNEKLTMKIDDETVGEVTSAADAKTLQAIGLTVNKGSSAKNKAYVQDKHFVDDISVIRNSAQKKHAVITMTIPVKEQPLASATIYPEHAVVAAGEPAVFTVSASTYSADPNLIYQWYRNDLNSNQGGVMLTDGPDISGASTAALMLGNAADLDGNYFYCVLTNSSGGRVASNVAKLTASAEQRPGTPYNPVLRNDGTVQFGLDTRASYEFSFAIYKEGAGTDTPIATVKRVIATDSSNVFQGASLLDALRAAGEGTYCYTVQARDTATGLTGEVSGKSNGLTLAKLPAPASLTWQGAALKWAPVPGARAYEVQLYKDGSASGSAATVNAPAAERLMTLSGKGAYTATVKALASSDTLYFDSPVSAPSAAMDQSLRLTFDQAGLSKGSRERIYLEGPDDYGIDGFRFASSHPAVSVDQYGYLTVAEDLEVPASGMDVTISAEVEYYDDTVWANNMESFGKFAYNELSTTHATNNGARLRLMSKSELPGGEAARTGRLGTTPYAVDGYGSNISLAEAATGSLIFWYYDPYTAVEQADADKKIGKFGVAINVSGSNNPAAANFAGVAYNDGTAANTHYAYRTSGTNWFNVPAARSAGWHKFEFRVTAAGMELYVDGVKARDLDPGITQIKGLQLCNNWGTQGGNSSYINGKHFIDDIYVIREGAQKKTETVQTTIRVLPKQYTIDPAAPEFDLQDPQDLPLTVSPDLTELNAVTLDGAMLTDRVDYEVAGNTLVIRQSALAGKSVGQHQLVLMVEGSRAVPFSISVIETLSRAYYVDSAKGNDDHDGSSPDTAWKTLAKLNAVGSFQYGDRIYLQESGIWNEQLVLRGQGRPGKPIILTKYAVVDGEVKVGAATGNTGKRPVINGMGTEGKKPSYIVQDNASGAIKLNGTVELWDSSFWELSWLEVTNMGPTPGNGRSGIMVISDYTPNANSERTVANWLASKKEHIYITDCYVHDVNGKHQAHDGTKHAGGIVGYGYLSDFRVERNRVSRVDNEGIRNTVFHPGGTNSAAGYPADADTRMFFKNNFIDKVAGDAMVMAGVNFGEMSYNVATALGRSYVTGTDQKPLSEGAEPVLLGSQNYAAMWVMGSKNSVAQYNEVFDTQYNCPDGEAWDIDLYSENYVYQYNYSHRNAGGAVLFMGGSKNNIFRYNLSIEDGGYANRPHLVYYAASGSKDANAYPLIYNNVFALSNGIKSLFDGNTTHSNYLHFQNNIVYANNENKPNLFFRTGEVIDGGSFTNNLFWPADLYGANITGYLGDGMTVKDNRVADPGLLGGGPEDIPALSAEWQSSWQAGKYLTSDNWFDAKVNGLLGGYKLSEDSPAIDAGVKVAYWPDIPQENRFPISRDFFGNPVDENDPDWTPDIGIHEFSNERKDDGIAAVSFDFNGGGGGVVILRTAKGMKLETWPNVPVHAGGLHFQGWNTAADGTGTSFTADTVVTGDITVYAQWSSGGGGDTGGGDTGGGDTGGGDTGGGDTGGGDTGGGDTGGGDTGGGDTGGGDTGGGDTGGGDTGGGTGSSGDTGGSAPVLPALTISGAGSTAVKENADGSITYTFKPEAGEKLLFVRVNGITTPVSGSYTVKKGTAPSIVAIFSKADAKAAEGFDDVAALPAYARSAIDYVTSAQLFNGTGEREFAPDAKMTRGMFVTVMARLYGAKAANYAERESGFTDVPSHSWYAPSVVWGLEAAIVDGAENGRFAPDQNLTRQELITFIHRFALKMGADVSAAGDLTLFDDADQVSSWAREAMTWAVGLGLINGRSNHDLAPADAITRVEASIILERMAALLVHAADK